MSQTSLTLLDLLENSVPQVPKEGVVPMFHNTQIKVHFGPKNPWNNVASSYAMESNHPIRHCVQLDPSEN